MLAGAISWRFKSSRPHHIFKGLSVRSRIVSSLALGPYVVQDRSAPVGTEWAARDRTYIFGEAALAKRMVVCANRYPDKLEVCDPAILLKPHNEAKAKVALCLSDGGRLSVIAFAPASFWS